MQTLFLVTSALLPLGSAIVYIKSILGGQTRPHRTTRFVILVITLLTTSSLWAQHDRVAIWLSLVSTIQAIAIFFLSFKHGMGGSRRTDIACLVLAGLGVIIWQATDNPALGLFCAIGADFVGMVPTIIKTYQYPWTEIASFYVLDTIAAGFNLLALTTWTPEATAFPLYILFINGLIALLVIRPQARTAL
jgi:hypothetical protein